MSYVLRPPASESLLEPQAQGNPWPEEVLTSVEVELQRELRRKIRGVLQTIFDCLAPVNIGTMDIQEAVESGQLDSAQVVHLYDDLVNFLNEDKYYARLLLYLPFEVIPPMWWLPQNKDLEAAISRFNWVYLANYHDLLSIADVRANFVDGDVPEVELRHKPLERVVKAAHLLPILMHKGLLSEKDAVQLIEQSETNKVLFESLVDVLPVLREFELLSAEKLNRLEARYNIDFSSREVKLDVHLVQTPARKRWLDRQEGEKLLPQKLNSPVSLDGSFAEKIPSLKSGLKKFEKFLISLNGESEISSYLYPVIVIFGSRLKGYGIGDSDIDYGVFIKPEVGLELRSKIKELLIHSGLSGSHGETEAIEFWLEEDGSRLKVKDFPVLDKLVADSSWAHVLFGGAWYGAESVIQELHRRLLTGYLSSSRDRRIWLEELEKDTLQYRLLHSGYDRHFPEQGRMKTESARWMNGSSAFFDSGFRRVATQLFFSKVFLPII